MSNAKTTHTKNKVSPSRNTRYLTLFVIIVLAVGAAVGYLNTGNGNVHWMEGPLIALLTCFMPLTAISFLHFRLPRIQDDFHETMRALNIDNKGKEAFSGLFVQNESSSDYLLPIFFISLFSMFGFYMLTANNALVLFNGMEWIKAAGDTGLIIDNAANAGVKGLSETPDYRRGVVAVSMAFLGAYVWSIQYIFRRMITLDLPPGAYYSVGSRMVYSAFLAIIVEHFIFNAGNFVILQNQIVAVSFLIGIFPSRALNWMKDSIGTIFAEKKHGAKSMPLEMLEGISVFHKTRLSELGIDNVQNLAQSSLIELILKTPFKPRVLIDWVAQARLCIEFKDKTEALRGAGVRTILDLQEVCTEPDLVDAVAKNSGIDKSLILTVYHNNKNEASIDRLRSAYDTLNVI